MRLIPCEDRIVVEPAEADEKTPGGILLPETARQRPRMGRILAVGPGKLKDDGKRVPLDFKVGETVLYGPYAGSDFLHPELDTLKILAASEVLAKVEQNDRPARRREPALA